MCRKLSAFAFLIPSFAFGWGPDGHSIVGEIAWKELKPAVKDEVRRLIAEDPDFGRFSESCTWADQIKSKPEWNWARPLHYADIAGQPGEEESAVKVFDMSRDCGERTDCPDGPPCPTHRCVVDAISYYDGVLGDPLASDQVKLIALKFLGHFVGDIHQPLHAGYARDKGGNDKRIEFFNQRMNLHSLWDSGMIRRKTNDWVGYASELHARITDEQRSAWQADFNPEVWANESHRLCPRIYRAIPSNGKVGEAYFDEMLPVLEVQLQKAGVRLGAMINAALGK